MVNYACAFSHSESGKYFEWIISGNKTLQGYKPLAECITFFTTFVVIDAGQSLNSSVISEY